MPPPNHRKILKIYFFKLGKRKPSCPGSSNGLESQVLIPDPNLPRFLLSTGITEEGASHKSPHNSCPSWTPVAVSTAHAPQHRRDEPLVSRFPNISCDLSSGLHSVESSCALKTPLPRPMVILSVQGSELSSMNGELALFQRAAPWRVLCGEVTETL